MIKGIGIDIVEKQRIQQVLERTGDKFLFRILTPMEVQSMPRGDRRTEYVAGRFAAKEAMAKATGLGIGQDLGWQDMEIEKDERGKPVMKLSETWMRQHFADQQLHIHVSISHEKSYAVAQVIVETAE